jgi:hypothetical protein
MRSLVLLAGVVALAVCASADSGGTCPSTVTSCSITLGSGTSTGYYNVAFQQNPTPFWEGPVSGWPPVFKALLTPSELASGTVPYNVEYDFVVGIDVPFTPGNSAQVTVDFQLPPSETNWVVIGHPDDYGGNNATFLTADGGPTGAGGFSLGPGSAFVLTAVPGQLIVSSSSNPGNAGDTSQVPEPAYWPMIVCTVGLIAGFRRAMRKTRYFAKSTLRHNGAGS